MAKKKARVNVTGAKDRAIYSRTAGKTNSINVNPKNQRGGIRL